MSFVFQSNEIFSVHLGYTANDTSECIIESVPSLVWSVNSHTYVPVDYANDFYRESGAAPENSPRDLAEEKLNNFIRPLVNWKERIANNGTPKWSTASVLFSFNANQARPDGRQTRKVHKDLHNAEGSPFTRSRIQSDQTSKKRKRSLFRFEGERRNSDRSSEQRGENRQGVNNTPA